MQRESSFSKETTTGALYLVPTPIGNLGDMTYRSVAVLKEVAVIAAEDTRNTQKLLNHFEIETPQISFHEHNTQERIPQLIARLQSGDSIAQVSDAGTPSISDPGKELVAACVEQHLPVVPLPGANAGISALIASGIAPQPFYFYGFLDRKPSRQKEALAKLVDRPETLIFYEAPHRLAKTLQSLVSVFGESRRVVLGRELTKKHEEFIRGTLGEVSQWAKTDQVRGEFVMIVSGNDHPETTPDDNFSQLPLEQHVQALIDAGQKPTEAIKNVAHLHGLKKQEVYQIFHHIEKD